MTETLPLLRLDRAAVPVPDAAAYGAEPRSDLMRSSSPPLVSSPGPYSDDGLDADLASIETADLTGDPQDAREYAPAIMAYLRDLEVRLLRPCLFFVIILTSLSMLWCACVWWWGGCGQRRRRPRPTYMARQRDINVGMRAMLLDWLVDVRGEFALQHETLYLAAGLLDRFLSLMHVARARLQLVGVACLLIARCLDGRTNASPSKCGSLTWSGPFCVFLSLSLSLCVCLWGTANSRSCRRRPWPILYTLRTMPSMRARCARPQAPISPGLARVSVCRRRRTHCMGAWCGRCCGWSRRCSPRCRLT
jgi:hypothetical protein